MFRSLACWPTQIRVVLIVLVAVGLNLPATSLRGQPASGVQSIASISATLAPATLEADGSTQPALFIQARGPDGSPVRPSEPVTVHLRSSNPAVATVPLTITLGPESSYVSVGVTTTNRAGSARLNASAPGLGAASAELLTVHPFGASAPFELQLSAWPPVAYPGTEGILTVAVLGQNRGPVPATAPIEVFLTSSNPDVAEVPESVLIPAGAYRAATSWSSRDLGRATITAQAQGTSSTQSEVRTDLESGTPSEIVIAALPEVTPAGGEEISLAMQAKGEDGLPAAFPCVDVVMTSSDPQVAAVPAVLSVECGTPRPFLIARIRPGEQPGTAAITASAPGLSGDSAFIESHGVVPTRLNLGRGPEAISPLDPTPLILVVQVSDDAGRPARVHRAAIVEITSPQASDSFRLTIGAGESLAYAAFPVTSYATEIQVTAAAEELVGVDSAFAVKLPQLEISLQDLGLQGEDRARSVVEAHVTSAGSPIANAIVTWGVSGAAVGSEITRTDSSGVVRFTVPAGEGALVSVTAKALATGYLDANSEIDVLNSGQPAEGSSAFSRFPYLITFGLAATALAWLAAQRVLARNRRRRASPAAARAGTQEASTGTRSSQR